MKNEELRMKSNNKTPQTISALIGEVGEGMVLFKLYELAHDHEDLEVFKNFSEPGYDCGIRNHRNGRKARVEVKTRQRLITTGASENKAQFRLSENELDHADFMVGYWMDYNDFFVIPTADLKNTEKRRHIARRNQKGTYGPSSMNYLSKWDLILNHLQ